MIIEKIQARDGPVRRGNIRLLLYAHRPSGVVESHHTVALGITDSVGDNRSALYPVCCELEHLSEAVSEKEIITQHECHAVRANKVGSDQESLRKPLRPWLLGITQADRPLTTVAEQPD